MEFLTDLWLPILVSGVFVFIASSVIHMALPIHKGDYQKLSSEDAVLDAMRKNGVSPGDYMFPCASSMKEMGSPEMMAKFSQGPVGYMTVLPNGPPAIGKSLFQWFVFTLVVSLFTAYLGSHALDADADPRAIFRITGTVAVLGYAVGNVPSSIWKGQSWVVTAKFLFDGLVYGVVTGATFAWLWA